MTEGSSSKASASAIVYGPPPGWLVPLLLGVMIGLGAWMLHDIGRIYTEIRILQEHVSNTNAVLISKGLKKPDDPNS